MRRAELLSEEKTIVITPETATQQYAPSELQTGPMGGGAHTGPKRHRKGNFLVDFTVTRVRAIHRVRQYPRIYLSCKASCEHS